MSRRGTITMSDDEVHEFLAGRHTMNVASMGPDGRIHLVAMWYGFTADGAPAFWTYGKSQKILNLRRDPQTIRGGGGDRERGEGGELRTEVIGDREDIEPERLGSASDVGPLRT